MDLRVISIGIFDGAQEQGKDRVTAEVDFDFNVDGVSGGSRWGVNFEISGARDMTFRQLEALILEKAQAALK